MSKRVMIGSKVRHDYSGEIGYVLAYRRNKERYNYQVEWQTVVGGKLHIKTDWYRREVLILL